MTVSALSSSRVRRLARTVLRVYVYSLLLLLTVRSCVQVIGHAAEAVKTLATGWWFDGGLHVLWLACVALCTHYNIAVPQCM